MVKKLGLSTFKKSDPYHIEWLNECGILKITHVVQVPFIIDDYKDEIICDVIPMKNCDVLLGCPWQYDRSSIHDGRTNQYKFSHKGKVFTLFQMSPSDVHAITHADLSNKHSKEPIMDKSILLVKMQIWQM